MGDVDGTHTGDRFIIDGGYPLGGDLTPSGNKNEALPVIAAALLVRGPVVIENLPRIRDVDTMLQVIRGLGASVAFSDDHTVTIDASSLPEWRPDPATSSEIRGSFLLAAPLLARHGRAVLPAPGGDRIGRRRVDTHLLALAQLGASVEPGHAYHLELRGGRFVASEIFLDEASVTATETALMAAAVAEGTTRILNAACEPHVQGLCHALNTMGAVIRGIGSNVLEIAGYGFSTKIFWAARTPAPKSTGTPSPTSTCSSAASAMTTSNSAA
jgi:UDP-N-acetylglucosamine 1-carboxyvinyltransferase